MKSPIVVAGMHRSGTSLVASILSALGVDMGERMLEADRNNRRGYFEDLSFLDLNRRMLRAAARPDDGGHPDWGWTESETLDRRRFQEREAEASSLAGHRAGSGGLWGWKDPRTTLLLDFWDRLLGDAFYVLVYRFPWEVADSMQRLGADVFLRRPDYAWRIWAFYNRHLLDFHRRHRDRSLLVSTDALLRQPGRLPELLRDRLGLETSGAGAEDLLEEEIFHAPAADDPLIPLALAAHPACAALLRELDAQADLPAAGLWSDRPPAARPTPADGGRVSVVIPCFDQGEFLIEAVASVERAVPEPCELIVVNDGSREPRTLEILEVLRRAGYRIGSQENAGLAAARNLGFELARAPYVVPLDADNRLRPGFVEEALQILDNDSGVGVVYGDRSDFGLRSEVVDVPPFKLDEILPFNFIDACAVVRKEVWRACGGYDAEMPEPGWEDWDLWIGAAGRGWKFHHLPVVAFDYRVRPGSMISAFDDEELRRRVLGYVIAKHRDLYWRRLPELLVAAQRSAALLHRVARDRERLRSETEAAAEHRELLAHAEALRAKIAADTALYQAEREARLRGEETIATLLAEIEALRAKIAADAVIYQAEREARLRGEKTIAELVEKVDSRR
ncbi:MAG TPA: glycosyltransferase [Thermoanaerobaculia bacterium]|nr:glycosyltransferase [Thermoanaerobaculia bacterium]